VCFTILLFFSSRRRHTRLQGDWSSDMCSSDLTQVFGKVGFVPQLPPPLKMPVGQLLGFAAAVCGTDAERMHALARRLGLDVGSILARPFNRLSGGMKQKLLIAIALGRDTELLVMDEPAANLDPEARHIFFNLLAERLGSTTMIISSHRLDEVASLVNRVVEMDTGRIVLDDRVAEESRFSALFEVHLTLARADAAIARTLGSWQFADRRAGVEWHGTVSGADRLRFLGMVARYVGLLSRIEMHEVDAAVVLQ
ncbi:MAG TPA: hypothetical protein DCY47_02660, partial [Candidatus Accumulibacter sp.]|nr:hypothetical protein [Accumulibacter sp.]